MCACGNATPTSLASTCVFDVIKIFNVKLFVDFIFVRRGIIRNIRKFAPIQNFPLYGRFPHTTYEEIYILMNLYIAMHIIVGNKFASFVYNFIFTL